MRYTAITILISGILFACPHASGQEQDAPPRARPADSAFGDAVISESGQFRIRGGEGALRGTVALLADQTRDEFLRLIGEPQAEFKIPVHITLVGRPGDTPPPQGISTSITYNENGYDLRLNVHVARSLDVGRFQNAVTAVLVYERCLANHRENDSDTPLLVQPWLVEGLREANRWHLGTSDRRLYDVLFRSGGLFKLDDLFTLTHADHHELDAASRAAFQVSSGALVMALLDQPDGRKAFPKFLTEVALFAGEMPSLLRRFFPDLNLSENSMEKWWGLQLADKGAARLTESLTIAETETALEDALQLRFRNKDGGMLEVSIHEWAGLAELDEIERLAAVRMAEDGLVRLSYRSFPSYRPLLASYQNVLNKIARDNTKPEDIAIQLDELAATRETMIAKAARARDYMDWFEITRARETSGAFDDYLRLKEQLRDKPPNTRLDPVSGLLDRFDTIFHRESDVRSARNGGAGWHAPTHLPQP